MSNEMSFGGVIACWAVGILVVAGAILGIWDAGWWFAGKDAQLGGQVDRSSYNFQQGHMDQLSSEIADLGRITTQITGVPADQAAALKAQRLAEAQQACRTARDITDATMNQESGLLDWRNQNCAAGSVSPTSQYSLNN